MKNKGIKIGVVFIYSDFFSRRLIFHTISATHPAKDAHSAVLHKLI